MIAKLKVDENYTIMSVTLTKKGGGKVIRNFFRFLEEKGYFYKYTCTNNFVKILIVLTVKELSDE